MPGLRLKTLAVYTAIIASMVALPFQQQARADDGSSVTAHNSATGAVSRMDAIHNSGLILPITGAALNIVPAYADVNIDMFLYNIGMLESAGQHTLSPFDATGNPRSAGLYQFEEGALSRLGVYTSSGGAPWTGTWNIPGVHSLEDFLASEDAQNYVMYKAYAYYAGHAHHYELERYIGRDIVLNGGLITITPEMIIGLSHHQGPGFPPAFFNTVFDGLKPEEVPVVSGVPGGILKYSEYLGTPQGAIAEYVPEGMIALAGVGAQTGQSMRLALQAYESSFGGIIDVPWENIFPRYGVVDPQALAEFFDGFTLRYAGFFTEITYGQVKRHGEALGFQVSAFYRDADGAEHIFEIDDLRRGEVFLPDDVQTGIHLAWENTMPFADPNPPSPENLVEVAYDFNRPAYLYNIDAPFRGTLVLLGDSILDGAGQQAAHYRLPNVVNHGLVSSAPITSMQNLPSIASRFDEAIAGLGEGDAIVINGGFNNDRVSPEARARVMETYGAMIDTAQSRGIIVILMGMHHVDTEKCTFISNSSIDAMNVSYASLAAEKGITFFVPSITPDLLEADGVHLHPSAYKNLLEEISAIARGRYNAALSARAVKELVNGVAVANAAAQVQGAIRDAGEALESAPPIVQALVDGVEAAGGVLIFSDMPQAVIVGAVHVAGHSRVTGQAMEAVEAMNSRREAIASTLQKIFGGAAQSVEKLVNTATEIAEHLPAAFFTGWQR